MNQASLVGVELISLGVVDLDKLDAGKKHCIRLCWEQEGSGRSVFTSNTISGIVGMEELYFARSNRLAFGLSNFVRVDETFLATLGFALQVVVDLASKVAVD